jgi:hypothetical protein
MRAERVDRVHRLKFICLAREWVGRGMGWQGNGMSGEWDEEYGVVIKIPFFENMSFRV